MAQVAVRLPSMLAHLAKSERVITLQAETVGGSLEALLTEHPELRVHIFDEQHRLRPHVSCFHNETMVRDAGMDRLLSENDTITIMQAVSGGRANVRVNARVGKRRVD